MDLRYFTKPVVVHSKSRSNIYVLGELIKLIENLENGKDNFKSTLVNQAAYFHIINPKDFASDLVSSWLEIRNAIGYQDISTISNSEAMRQPIRAKIDNFTQDDIDCLMENLYGLKSQLLAEFKK